MSDYIKNYQALKSRIPWREAMTEWLRSEGVDVDNKLKELEALKGEKL